LWDRPLRRFTCRAAQPECDADCQIFARQKCQIYSRR
jgi:hypothetical protein